MDSLFHKDEPASDDVVSTGRLQARSRIYALLDEAYQRYRHVESGAVADYLPALAAVPPELFAVCVAGIDGASSRKR